MKGFWIAKINVDGVDKPSAHLSFKKGANLLTGPSDTGKSYVFHVMNYTLGRSSEPPTEIPEANGYDNFTLKIVAFETDIEYTINRKISSSKIIVSTNNEEDRIYTTKGKANTVGHISSFFLPLCGLENKVLLKSKINGTKNNLTFTRVNQLTFISEERIVTRNSPFYFTGQFNNQILEQSLLSTLIDGEDFSSVETQEDNSTKKTRMSGKIDFIDSQLSRLSNEREEVIESQISLGHGFDELQREFLNQRLTEQIAELNNYEVRMEELKSVLHIALKEKIYHQELIDRFRILERQYESDSSRLEFIDEAENLSSQLPSTFCPFCNSEISESHETHEGEQVDFKKSIFAELEKIKSKLVDLQSSIKNSKTKLLTAETRITNSNNELVELQKQSDEFKPQIDELKYSLQSIIDFEASENRRKFIEAEIDKISGDKHLLLNTKNEKKVAEVVNLCDFDILEKLSKRIQDRLTSWNFLNKPHVTFNSQFNVFDIIISYQKRGSFGKGRRAISYTACILGLLDYLLEENKPFSNLIVIDSALTTFKDKNNGESKSTFLPLEKEFFKDLANTREDCQIILIDNKETETEININMIEFTQDRTIGRYGFFPVKSETV
jgi:hypothetical protein